MPKKFAQGMTLSGLGFKMIFLNGIYFPKLGTSLPFVAILSRFHHTLISLFEGS